MKPANARLAILLPDLRGGGAERVKILLAREFASRGHGVQLVLMGARGELLPEAKRHASIVELGAERMRDVPWLLAKYLRDQRPDALYAAMWPLTSFAVFGRLLSGHRCPVLVSEHGILSAQYAPRGRFHNAWMRLSMMTAYRLATARVGVSGGVARDAASLAAMPVDRFTVVNNPVSLPLEQAAVDVENASRCWGDRPGSRILFVGRFKRVKNLVLLLAAFARLLKSRHATLLLIGHGELEAELRQQAASLGLDDRVVFAGFHADTAPFYAAADLFVLSSDYEGFGNVIVEALACGTPVVSTDCPSGPAEILEGGRYGRLVPVGDAAALAQAMAEELAASHDPERLKARARDFAPEKAATRYLELLS